MWFVLFPIPLLTEILGGNEEEAPLAYSTLCASFPATPPSFTTTNSTTKFRIPAFTKYSPRPTSPQHQLATFHKLKKNIHTYKHTVHTRKNDIINIHKHHQDKHKHNHKHIQIDIRGKFRHFSNYPFQLPPPILYSPNPVIPSTDTPHIHETCLVLMFNPPVLLIFWRALASVCGLNRKAPIINHPRPPLLLLLQLQVKYDEEQSGPSLPPSLPTLDKFLRQQKKKRRVPKFPFPTLLWRLRRVVAM